MQKMIKVVMENHNMNITITTAFFKKRDASKKTNTIGRCSVYIPMIVNLDNITILHTMKEDDKNNIWLGNPKYFGSTKKGGKYVKDYVPTHNMNQILMSLIQLHVKDMFYTSLGENMEVHQIVDKIDTKKNIENHQYTEKVKTLKTITTKKGGKTFEEENDVPWEKELFD